MDKVDTAALLIRLGVGIIMALFGLSQLKSPDKWYKYIPGLVRFIMPIKLTSFMRAHGLINLVLGVLLCVGIWQPAIIWTTILWWGSILPFAFYYEFSVGLRDISIIMALISLLLLHYA